MTVGDVDEPTILPGILDDQTYVDAPEAVTALVQPGGVIDSANGAVVVTEKLLVTEIQPVLSVS